MVDTKMWFCSPLASQLMLKWNENNDFFTRILLEGLSISGCNVVSIFFIKLKCRKAVLLFWVCGLFFTNHSISPLNRFIPSDSSINGIRTKTEEPILKLTFRKTLPTIIKKNVILHGSGAIGHSTSLNYFNLLFFASVPQKLNMRPFITF